MKSNVFKYGEDRLSVGYALDIARGKLKGIIDSEATKRILASKKSVENIVRSEKIVYGVNTGFGPLCSTIISPNETQTLQYNILKSHSVGVGEMIPTETTKLMLILKMHSLAQGYSDIALETLERINWHIENDVIPIVPSQGSVGASGDLAPLAHLFLPLIGLGKVIYKADILKTSKLFQDKNLKPITLGPKEGLALINGTQFMAAHGIKAVERLHNCLESADIIGAMTLEALLGSAKPFEALLHEIRPHLGNQYVSHRLRAFLSDSEIIDSRLKCNRVQDPYSLRCMPQVHGASRNAWLHLKDSVNIEINSVTDNPIIVDENNAISGGNFHGEPIAIPLDYGSIAASELGNISDRRIYLLLKGDESGLPRLLLEKTGINSGFMILQYSSASLVSENKSLCFPPSADSVPTALGQEDHVSMGSISGRRINEIIGNVEKILAIELLSAAQALDFRKPLKSGKILNACHSYIREKIEFVEKDKLFSEDMETARSIIANNELVTVAEKVMKENNIDLLGDNYDSFRLY